jgi:hypothetical protein
MRFFEKSRRCNNFGSHVWLTVVHAGFGSGLTSLALALH